jgi:hypothetical protein
VLAEADIGLCSQQTPCPANGQQYYYCLAGGAFNGCQPYAQGPFPSASCKSQCLTPPTIPACTQQTPCPTDGQQYYYCTAGGSADGCSPLSQGPFPPTSCKSQCLTPPPPNRNASRTVRVFNRCAAPVWVGAIGDLMPQLAPGFSSWELAAGSPAAPTTLNFTLPAQSQGRIWGRTGCGPDPSSPTGWSCRTGDCGGQAACSVSGAVPAMLFEYSLVGAKDGYDISAVDGFNLPMAVTPTGAGGNGVCEATKCAVDAATCPPEARLPLGGGLPAGCYSACSAVNSQAQRAAFPVLQSIFTATVPGSGGKPMKDLVCCECGDQCGKGW